MKTFISVTVIVFSILALSFAFAVNTGSTTSTQSTQNQAYELLNGENKKIPVSPGVIVTQYWFFSGKATDNIYKSSLKNRDLTGPLTKGQLFGARVNFTQTNLNNKNVVVKFQLVAPTSAKTFSGNHGPGKIILNSDEKTVSVTYDMSALDSTAGHYWEIDGNDPHGAYELKIFVEGVLVETYRFNIE